MTIGLSLRQGATLAYLLLILLLGGASAAGFAGNVLLQIAGAGLIAWTLWSEESGKGLTTGARPFVIGLAALAAIQFLPLPPSLWQMLPGREAVAQGFALTGEELPWLSYSLDPWSSLQSLVWWIPAGALFYAMRAENSPETRHVVWVVLGVAYASVVLAAMQVVSGSGYLYAITNRGNGVGLFSNSNHFGSFMLIATALAAGQWLHDRPTRRPLAPRVPLNLELVLRLAPLVLGVLLSRSLAAGLLLLPLLGGIALLVYPQWRIRWPLVGIAAAVFAVGIVWLLSSGFVSNDLMSKSGTAGISRGEFLANGSAIARDFAPLGAGIGTFRDLYPWYESATNVSTTFVNHAHNDLLELLIETGILGLIVLGLFLRWIGGKSWTLWNADRTVHPVALAATLATALVLTHSLVDYPLRTAAVSSLIALCAILAIRPPALRGSAAVAQSSPGAGKREGLIRI